MNYTGVVRACVLVAGGGLPSIGFLEASSVLFWCMYGPAVHGSPSVPFPSFVYLARQEKMLIFQTLVNV
jgi:hypothetical protein